MFQGFPEESLAIEQLIHEHQTQVDMFSSITNQDTVSYCCYVYHMMGVVWNRY